MCFISSMFMIDRALTWLLIMLIKNSDCSLLHIIWSSFLWVLNSEPCTYFYCLPSYTVTHSYSHYWWVLLGEVKRRSFCKVLVRNVTQKETFLEPFVFSLISSGNYMYIGNTDQCIFIFKRNHWTSLFSLLTSQSGPREVIHLKSINNSTKIW